MITLTTAEAYKLREELIHAMRTLDGKIEADALMKVWDTFDKAVKRSKT